MCVCVCERERERERERAVCGSLGYDIDGIASVCVYVDLYLVACTYTHTTTQGLDKRTQHHGKFSRTKRRQK